MVFDAGHTAGTLQTQRRCGRAVTCGTFIFFGQRDQASIHLNFEIARVTQATDRVTRELTSYSRETIQQSLLRQRIDACAPNLRRNDEFFVQLRGNPQVEFPRKKNRI